MQYKKHLKSSSLRRYFHTLFQCSSHDKTYTAGSYGELKNSIAVNGGGGGYLSNEISYRSIRLRDALNSSIPTGHIHTPRIQQFEPETEAKIVKQIKAMLEQSLVAL